MTASPLLSRIDQIDALLSLSVEASERGEMIDLSLLQQQVDILCKDALALPADQRVQAKQRMETIAATLDSLSALLTARTKELELSLKSTTASQQAARAYTHAKKSES